MFLVIKVSDKINGYVNLGSDLSKAQDLLNMVENNIVFLEEGYDQIKILKSSATVEVTKEIVIEKEYYGDKCDNVVINDEVVNKSFVGTSDLPINVQHDLQSIQSFYLDKITGLKKVLKASQDKVTYLENELSALSENVE